MSLLPHRTAMSPSEQAKAHVRPAPRFPKRAKRAARGRADRDAIYVYGSMPGEDPVCFLAEFSDTPCGGRMEKAHLIKQQVIRKEIWNQQVELREMLGENGAGILLWDARVWRPACHTHHFHLDESKRIRLTRQQLPASVEEYAAEYGISWWLEKTYGPTTQPSEV